MPKITAEQLQWAGAALGFLVTALGGLWALIRFTFAPRLEQAIGDAVRPIVGRVDLLEDRVTEADTRIEDTVNSLARTEQAIEKVGEDFRAGMKDLADAVRDMSRDHSDTAAAVARLEGRLEVTPSPARTRKPRKRSA